MVERTKNTDPVDDSLDNIHRRLQESGAANLTAEPDTPNAWDRVKLARHPNRPYTLDYIELLFTGFFEIHGDRRFGDDPATSVLDRDNRAHELANLFVVDASFFPSSGGTNPSLTIAANALRVAEAIDRQLAQLSKPEVR